MVGYDTRKLHNLNNDDLMLGGAIAGGLTRLLCQPLDVIKVRLQLQVERPSRSQPDAKYHGTLQTCSKIVKEEGYRALYKGHVSAQLLSISYGIASFASFEYFTKEVFVRKPHMKDLSPVTFICGGAANGLATVISYPFDTIRTRFIGQGKPPVYTGLFNCIGTILKVEGFRSLYRGFFATLIQIIPHGGAQFAIYNKISVIFKEKGIFVMSSLYTVKDRKKYLSPFGSFLAGAIAGAGAKVAIYPLDLAKKRLQIQGNYNEVREGFGKKFVCSGLVDCIKLTYRNEGFFALYKGLKPTLLKAMIATSLHFAIYEQTLLFLSNSKIAKTES